jgi:hypothetical protein
VSALFGLGVSMPWAHAGPADFTPILAVAGAVLVVRFLIGLRLTALTVAMAVLGGSLWAAAIAQWGFSVPTLSILAAVGAASVAARPHPD